VIAADTKEFWNSRIILAKYIIAILGMIHSVLIFVITLIAHPSCSSSSNSNSDCGSSTESGPIARRVSPPVARPEAAPSEVCYALLLLSQCGPLRAQHDCDDRDTIVACSTERSLTPNHSTTHLQPVADTALTDEMAAHRLLTVVV
jgi:hypothetical protein